MRSKHLSAQLAGEDFFTVHNMTTCINEGGDKYLDII